MEAEWRLKVITDFIFYWSFGNQNWRCGMKRTLSQSAIEIWCFLPLRASANSEVRNDDAHVIMQDICNKFIEIRDFRMSRMSGIEISSSQRPLGKPIPVWVWESCPGRNYHFPPGDECAWRFHGKKMNSYRNLSMAIAYIDSYKNKDFFFKSAKLFGSFLIVLIL